MEISEILGRSTDALTARRVFSEPIQQGDVTVVLAAKVRGGGGGGEGQPGGPSSGLGTGFGMSARPAGAFVIHDGNLKWRPAIDVNRIILGGQTVLLIGLFLASALLRPRFERRHFRMRRLGRRLAHEFSL